MAITINGTGTITGISAGGLPDGSVTAADIESSLDLTGKTVTLPSGTGGKILQVQHTIKTARQNLTNTTAKQDITDMSVTITPASNSSKIIILFNLMAATPGQYFTVHLIRGSTEIFLGDAENNNARGVFGTQSPDAYTAHSISGSYVDTSHNSGGSPVTYKMQTSTPWSAAYLVTINSAGTYADASSYMTRGSSSMILMEVA
jgi:hypothetical protein